MSAKYLRWHDQIIDRARTRALSIYKERHRIHPRSLGGGDDPSNLVDLTYRERFLVHWLLTKTCTGRDRGKMCYAMKAMAMPLGGRIAGSWRYDLAKRIFKDEMLRTAPARARARKDALRRIAKEKADEKARRLFRLGEHFVGIDDRGRCWKGFDFWWFGGKRPIKLAWLCGERSDSIRLVRCQ